MNPPRLAAGTMTTQCAFSNRSLGIPLSGAAMISSITAFATDTRPAESPATATAEILIMTTNGKVSLFVFIRSSFRINWTFDGKMVAIRLPNPAENPQIFLYQYDGQTKRRSCKGGLL